MMRRDDRVQEAEGLRQGYIMRELGNRNSVGNRRWDGGFKTNRSPPGDPCAAKLIEHPCAVIKACLIFENI